MRGKEKMKKQPSPQPRAMKKLYAFTEKRSIDLSLSENPLGCSPLVLNALKNIEMVFNDYPAPNGMSIKKKLAQKFSVNEKSIFVANGSESIISDLPRVFCKTDDEVLVPALSFPLFAICSQLAGTKVITTNMTTDLAIDLSSMRRAISKRTRLIFICNPNNPTGSVLSKPDIIEFISNVPQNIVVVVDEANIEFGGESMINDVNNHNNLVVLRTFSKGFGLASLRIGFAVASQAIIQKLEEETPVFPISGMSEQLACIALDDDHFLRQTKLFVAQQRLILKNELKKLGCTVFPSQANNLFVKIPSSLSANHFVKQLAQKGVSVVAGSNFTGFNDSFFRVSVRDEKTNRLFIEKMTEIIKEAQ